MEKTYKRVPFDIELAKKIQSGEVEGRIVTREGAAVRIICFDAKRIYAEKDIIALVEDDDFNESIGRYRANGELMGKTCEDDDFVIELPEETSRPIEESELYQIGYKVGYKAGYKAGECIEAKEEDFNIEEVPTGDGSIVFHRHVPKPEFKPFDKVLVRSEGDTNNKWFPAIYAYYSDVVGHITTDHKMYEECIPFAGREHLVGTTNNPE